MGLTMRIDIYRRNDGDGKTSYLAVPQGQAIPNEATNVDWETELSGYDVDDEPHTLIDYAIFAPQDQIDTKGYAISMSSGRT